MTRRIFCKVLLVAVSIFGLLVLSNVLLAQGNSENAFDRVREVQERNTVRLMAIDGVEGTAVGLDQATRPVVTVFTENEGVPGIPEKLEGIPVKVVVTGKIYALAPPEGKGKPDKPPKEEVDPTSRFDRPVPIGVSTGHPAVTAGTIGCRVTNGTDVFALSNNHVYANENLASLEDAVIQPGTFDGGLSPADDIGTLYAYEDIYFDGSDNTIDAAIALSSTVDLGNATPSGGYGIPKSTTVSAGFGQVVKKYGRTTGLTKGQIWALNVTVDVGYSTGVARFVGQFGIVPTKGQFSAGGDSGSLIITQKGNPVGLLFAGGGGWTFANPIDDVLGAFGVTIDGK